jgi:hypothetical protein
LPAAPPVRHEASAHGLHFPHQKRGARKYDACTERTETTTAVDLQSLVTCSALRDRGRRAAPDRSTEQADHQDDDREHPNTHPMSADIPAIPPKPSAAATTSMMKKTIA